MSADNATVNNQLEELRETVARLENENARLDELAQQYDAANRAKSDFLAMISHEIRTPMNGVIGLTELLLDTELDTKQNHYTGLILTSARNLLTLINSLLDFSKIEADMMELDIADFSLRNMVGELITLYSVASEKKDVEVSAEIDPQVAEVYRGDSYRIRQILVNLLGNAMKFTEVGSVVLKVVFDSLVNDKHILRFEVRDSGPGIPSDKLDRLFKPFTQVDTSSTRRYGGTGLGLSICQKLVELMGGEIGVESEKKMGSTFFFKIPLQQVSGNFEEDPQSPVQSNITTSSPIKEMFVQEVGSKEGPLFIIVDDDETNRFVLETVLLKSGARVLAAKNGMEAIELFEMNEPDLILMDCQMPVMDGFDASVQIHSMAADLSRKKPCIIALTADATKSTQQHCKEVGMDDYLTKPLEFGKLQRVIDNWMPGSGIRVVSRRMEQEAGENTEFIKDEDFSGIHLDLKVLERLKQNMGDVTPVIKVFLGSLPNRMVQLKKAVEGSDDEEIRRIAHTLKGSSSQFGANYLSFLCFRAEILAKNKKLENIQELYGKICQAVNEMVKILTEELDKK